MEKRDRQMTNIFREKYNNRVKDIDSLLCVGLDPDPTRIPAFVMQREDGLEYFIREIVEATKDYAAAYKPNFGFFLPFGMEGFKVLSKMRELIPSEIPIILDAKFADIGNTSGRYAAYAFEELNIEAMTVNPYMGSDSIEPFLKYKEREIIALCLTSNKGSADLQMQTMSDGRPLYMQTAKMIKDWDDEYGNCSAVVGATNPDQMKDIRNILTEQSLLVPGIGAQGGDLQAVADFLITDKRLPVMINSSRGIIFASDGENFGEAANRAAAKLVNEIRLATS